MRIISKRKDVSTFLDTLRVRASGDAETVEQAVKKILTDVQKNGDHAVKKYTRRFDQNSSSRLRLSPATIHRVANKADATVVRALELSAKRIRKFHEMQKERSWSLSEEDLLLGQIIHPLKRVGVYVPGGTAAYPSTVLMNVIPARVAGVKEIALCVPAPGGSINPSVMAAVRMLNIDEVYTIGGVQAIGAMAYGTQSIKKVDKIVGPGNVYVATAKKMVFGLVDIDMIAGPSEILIIADRSANAAFVAADLLSQAEHDELASSILLTTSKALANAVSKEISGQLSQLKRKKIARASLQNYGAIIITKNVRAALDLSNQIAPEHLEIMLQDPFKVLPHIYHAGAIFLGPWTPEAVGDYAAGPNHTLPTGGTARFFSPLGVHDFFKRSSLLGFTRKGFMKISQIVETLADAEGLEAHAYTIRVRRPEKMKNRK
ncbi:MAG: histidinol dehydrogenase [Nitrospiraceae bacterium]|nr:MAG: histidinol dehydrogenase [Nitrospiraceae bacterium]